jgi:phenylalanyl-tRNA synthetase beta chain
MKLPLSWLREWIEFEATPEGVAEALTTRGFYVEDIETRGATYPGVVVARVLEVQKHPNADKLSLCRVDGGAGELRVVCGAPNVKAGMWVPLANVGAKLPGGVAIKKSKIRGEESQGMLCSPRELELSDDHEGILDLERWLGEGGHDAPAMLRLGRPFEELGEPPDTILEIEIPFNRPDGMGVLGLAREARAALGGRWTAAAGAWRSARWRGRSDFDLELEDREGCPRYIAQCVEDVQVGPSPAWIRRRLESAGQRSINNIVDITNLVLLEFGQPLHAFDFDRLAGRAIRVRRAAAGESIVTLDDKQRALDPEVLVIADRERPVAVAGVMGGRDSEVSERTTSLLLECAWFDPTRVRRGSRRLGLSTEASKRYERGVDPDIGSAAAARFLALLKDVSPAARPTQARERDLMENRRRMVMMRPARASRLVGIELGGADARRQLEALEFQVESGDSLRVTVPAWRPDVRIEEDLIEEVARSHGYDKIPEAPVGADGVRAERAPRERMMARARRAMLARGLHEAIGPALIGEDEARRTAALFGIAAERLVKLENPTSREGEVLRPSPVAGLLRACARNLKQGAGAVRLFEIGTSFAAGSGALPDESRMLAAIVCGGRWAHAHDASGGAIEFEDARGAWDAWLEEMRVDTPEWRAYSADGWKSGASAELASGTSRIGWAGPLDPALLGAWDIEVPVHLFAVLLDALPSEPAVSRAVMPGRFPPVRRDVAFFVPSGTSHAELERVLVKAGGRELRSVEVFDVYAGPGTPAGMKSLAYALEFQDAQRTFTESEIREIQDRMVKAVATECGGQLRER